MNNDDRITYFAETDARNKRVAFGIKAKDRLKHVYVIGKTGMGKSTLLENMAVQDIQNGEGMAFIDPHGKSADLLLEYVPKERINDVVYFAPFDTDYPISFNVMEDVGPDKRHLVVSGLISAFKKIWVDAWSARMEYILTNCLLALLEYPDATLMGVNKMLSDKDYRKKIVDNVTDPTVRSFWVDEFAKYGQNYMQEAGAAIQNKIGQFTTNPVIRNVIGQPKSSFDIRTLMDQKKILIVNLSKGRVGEVNANLLGSMLITKIYLGAMSRADTPEAQLRKLPSFYLYVDEFQSFANDSFKDILSEARKYKLNLTIAHQYIEQMEEEIRAAVIGNVGTMITFRVGAFDAEVLEKEFAPTFTAADLVNLSARQIYLKLMINDVSSSPFSASTLPPIKTPEVSYVKELIEASRKTYSQTRAMVEEHVRVFSGFAPTAPALPKAAEGEIRQERIVAAPRPQTPIVSQTIAPKPVAAGEREHPREQAVQPKPVVREYVEPEHPAEEQFERDRRDRGPRDNDAPKIHEHREEPKKNPFAGIKLEQSGTGPARIVREEEGEKEPNENDVLSLSSLVPKTEPKKANANSGKAPTPQNVNALRDVLSSILKKNPIEAKEAPKEDQARKQEPPKEAKKEEKAEQAAPKQEAKREEPPSEPKRPEFRESSREVPAEVLKKVLSMDEKS